MKKTEDVCISKNERVEEFINLFSKESSSVRKEIVSLLPAFNELLSMNALTFEQFALLPYASVQKCNVSDVLFDYNTIVASCPFCGNLTDVSKIDNNQYFCAQCKKKFAANYNSITSRTKIPSIVWLKVLRCMLEFYSQERTCDICDIAVETFLSLRNHIFYAMELMMEDVKLYGNIQCDNKFDRLSYKGTRLTDNDYPEDSIFFKEDSIPREPRKRGRANRNSEKNTNSGCIFTAIDEYGHLMVRLIGVGAANEKRISNAVGKNKILLTVPTEDPFLFAKNNKGKRSRNPGAKSLLISDKETAIKKFAEVYGIDHECHVFTVNGRQKKLYNNENDIQRVNAVHSRLETYLSRINHVSSKYLPGFLTMFEFIENTGASDEAINQLFILLAKQNLGKSPEYYKSRFSTPNHLLQWLSDDNPLKRFKQEQLLAFYLYSKRLEALENKTSDVMTVKEISERCNMTAKSVRRNYKNLKNAGYKDLIYAHYLREKPRIVDKKPTLIKSEFYLEMYDEYCKLRASPNVCITLSKFVEAKKAELQNKGEDYARYSNMNHKQVFDIFKRIEKTGLRPPMPPITPSAPKRQVPSKAMKVLEDFEAAALAQRQAGNTIVKVHIIYEDLSKKYNITTVTVKKYLDFARAARKKHEL